MPQLAYRAATSTGNGWAMLPSAAAFIDPLFPTGFPLTLLGIERLGRMLEEDRFNQAEVMKEYNEVTKGIAWLPPWRSSREFSLGPLSVTLPFDSSIFVFLTRSYRRDILRFFIERRWGVLADDRRPNWQCDLETRFWFMS